MNPLRSLIALLRRSRLEADMADEMRAHLEEQIARNAAAGMSPDDARAAAHRQFGGVAQIQERARDGRGFRWLDDLGRDARLGLRQLRKSPGFTVVAVLTLAFGIGVNTSMFSALQALLMRELPYPEADRLVQVFRTSPHSQRWPHSPANFLEQQAGNAVFERMAALQGKPFNFATPGQPAERVRGMLVSADVFPLLGITPEAGRVFTTDEDRPGHNQVAVLSHAFWQRRFAADPEIVGQTLRLDGELVTVLGVMPETFSDRVLFGSVEVWRPIAFSEHERQNRGGNYLQAIARLRPDVSLAQAQAEMKGFAARQSSDHPETNTEIGLRVVRLDATMDPRGQMAVWLVMALAGFVLLIACANLANLQFARTARRTHELAIRGALGAGRGRIVRQLLTESLVVAGVGGLLGLLLAAWGNQLLSQQLVDGDRVTDLPLNLPVLGFALGAATVSGFAFGLVPAWLASRTDVNHTIKQGARGTTTGRAQHRLQHALIVAEMALTLVLLAGAGLVVRGLQTFAGRDPGWTVDGVTLGYLNLPSSTYRNDAQRAAFVNRLQEKLAALPGVTHASVAWSLPVSAFNVGGDFKLADRPAAPPGREPLRFVNGITPDYFATLQMRLLAGRTFTDADIAGGPAVVIINVAMARAFWPDESPLGRRVDGEEIVGVVNDVGFPVDPSEPTTRFQTYRPFAQSPRDFLAVALRGHVSVELVRRTVAELDPDLPLNQPGLAADVVTRSLGKIAGAARILSAFAILGLLLAALGIYGVIAGFVVQRTHEIGIRMALGARLHDVLRLVFGRSLRLTLTGTGIGLAGAFALGHVLASVAPGMGTRDPLAIGLVSVLLLAVAMLACWLPARRAARIEPMEALRND